jgi:hypothetical protein
MITGRYAHGNDGMHNESEANQLLVDKKGSYDSHFDKNKSDTTKCCMDDKTLPGKMKIWKAYFIRSLA